MAESLDTLGVPPEYRERAKIMWLLTIFCGIGAWAICNFLWKIEGQENNQWFQYQLKQNLYVGIACFVGWWLCGLGGLIQLVYGVMGFLALNKGEDFESPVIGGMCK
jgi:hypothetical protein